MFAHEAREAINRKDGANEENGRWDQLIQAAETAHPGIAAIEEVYRRTDATYGLTAEIAYLYQHHQPTYLSANTS